MSDGQRQAVFDAVTDALRDHVVYPDAHNMTTRCSCQPPTQVSYTWGVGFAHQREQVAERVLIAIAEERPA